MFTVFTMFEEIKKKLKYFNRELEATKSDTSGLKKREKSRNEKLSKIKNSLGSLIAD